MGLSSFQVAKILCLSLLLLALALIGAESHAGLSPAGLAQLQSLQQQIASKPELDLREKDLQIQFLSRLIFQAQSKCQDDPLRSCLPKALGALVESREFGEFVPTLIGALSELLEKNEDPIALITSYLQFSSLQQPKSLDEFAETRSYSDGKNTYQADPFDLEAAAEYLEFKEREKQKAQLSAPVTDLTLQNSLNP